jgi:siroheme synthase-like protein
MPINLSLKGLKCLVVGGGTVALRKVETLIDYDTNVTVIAPEVHEKIDFYAEKGRIKVEKRSYDSPEAATYGLVISASDKPEVNRQVSEDARGAGVLVNVADQPDLCDFIFPAVLRRDCLTVAISTDGKAPFMSGHLRMILDNVFPNHWARLMSLAADFRNRVRDHCGDDVEKKTVAYTRFVQTDWKTMLKEMSDDEINRELDRLTGLDGK